MNCIEVIEEDSPHLAEVKRLWRENSDRLGFFPDGAFIESVHRREILVALQGGLCCGYLIYYKSKRGKVGIRHLCVAESFRGGGIARLLVEDLRSRTKTCLGIGLYSRRDFPAWNLWPKLGFVPISEKMGRGRDGGILTHFWSSNSQAGLFGHRPPDDERLDVVLDANVFYDLDDKTRNGAEESQGLLADWLDPLIRLCITAELFNEIHRQSDPRLRAERLRTANNFERLECSTDDFLLIEAEVRALLGDPRTDRDSADVRQVARTIASRATVFVTRDEPLLGHADKLYEKYGLNVVRPSEVVGRFDELRNEPAFQRERLAGTRIEKRRLPRPDESLAATFRESTKGEKLKSLTQRINTFLAVPDRYNCFVVSDASSPEGPKPLAFYVTEAEGRSLIRIPLFRLASSIRSTRLAGTLFRTLLAGIVEQACRSHTGAVIFDEPVSDPAWPGALHDSGFVPTGPAWAKLGVRLASQPEGIGRAIRSALAEAGLECDRFSAIAELAASGDIRQNPVVAAEAEHLLWPAKILECGIPSYLVPIRPGWAVDLFDSGLADDRLWGADVDLALNPESVYYRSARNSPFASTGRLLWYVSQSEDEPRSKKIRACSRLAECVVAPAKDLFRRYRRLGVYEWKHVLDTAKEDPQGAVMALKFDDTERFLNPLRWDDFQAIIRPMGVNTNLQSPIEIPETAFVEIYERGTSFDGQN